MHTVIRYSTAVVLAIGALYLAIWPHELGHSVMAFLFGCKSNWWQTDMSWYLWDSWGGRIDYDCLRGRGNLALGLTDFSGIAVNLILLGLAPLAGRWRKVLADPSAPPSWWFLATFCCALANYAEAFSYLIVNTAWLSSDMQTVVAASGLSRWLWLAVGIVLASLSTQLLSRPAQRVAAALATSPNAARLWLFMFCFYVVAAGTGMAIARLVLT